MGSLTSRPKVPKIKPVSVTPAVQQPQTPVGESDNDIAQTESEARQESLLSRSRSRFGTVQTSFRGLLSQSDPNIERKTLLGE